MKIIAQCPQCRYTWLLKAEAADRRIRCLKCKYLFRVPKLDEVPKAASVIKQAKAELYVDQDGKIYG